MTLRIAAVTAVAGAVVLASACGYALAGRGNALPAYVKTIGVPQFVNHSTMPGVDQALTQAVQTELASRGKYRVQPDASGVDAVLIGVVTSVSSPPVAFTANNQASSYSIVVTANVEFKDLKENKTLWANPSFRVSDQYQLPPSLAAGTAQNDPSSLFRQDANALDRMAKRFAREVVTSIFEAF